VHLVEKNIMFSTGRNERRSFPELVGRHAQQAAAYIAAQGNLFYLNLSILSYVFFQCSARVEASNFGRE
jgi:hypothetical protein